MALPSGMSACTMCVELMTGTAWVDYTDYISVVGPATQTRDVGSAYVFGEDTAVIGAGRLGLVEVPVRGVWTDATADPGYVIMTEFQTACGDMVAVRWAPAGCTTANRSFRTSTTASEVTSFTFVGGDAGSADILMWEATITSPDITEATYA